MKKNILIVIIFLQLFNNTSAQVPGYQGRRLIVEGSPLFNNMYALMYAFSRGKDSYSVKERAALKQFNFITPQVALDYAITRRKAIGLVYNVRHNAFDILVSNNSNYTSIKHDILTHDIRLKYTWYRKNWSLAPVGRYRYISAGYMFSSLNISQNSPFTTNNIKPSDFSVHFGTGNRYMLNNRLVLNYGVEVGLLASIFTIDYSSGAVTTQATYEKAFKTEYSHSVVTDCFARINVGLGGLF